MREAAFAWPPRNMLRASWSVDPLPDEFLAWQRDNLRQSVAHHEAGHSILMLAFGMDGVRATIDPDGGAGATFHAQTATDAEIGTRLAHRRWSAIWMAVMCHAGLEAELLLGGFRTPAGSEWRCSATSDHMRADAALGELFFRGRPHGYAKAVCRAVLCRNWQVVERIAQHLVQTGEWCPADTPGVAVPFYPEAGLVMDACLAYGEAAQPAGNRVLSDLGETRPHSPGPVGETPGHIHADARPGRREPNPGGASGVVRSPFAHPTISRRQSTQFAHASTGDTARALEES